MADALIETTATNPYESIVSDTTNQINSIQEQIQQVTSAINKLEQVSPTSPTLPKLRERLSELTSKVTSLTNTNDSAKSLLTAYNDSLANANTMQWIYQLKQAELNRAQKEADESYRKMADDVKRSWENYINALWNATASENAIINANAGREWASAQSTAEARARNYLSNAQAQAEANANMVTNLNAINDSRLNSNAWYVQLSQSNADNTLRQQVMNDFEMQLNAANNAAKYWWSSRWTSNIYDPYEAIINWNSKWNNTTNTINKNWNQTNENWNQKNENTQPEKLTQSTTDVTNFFDEEIRAWTYWNAITDPQSYQNNRLWHWLLKNWYWWTPSYDLDRDKVKSYIEKQNNNNWHWYEDFNLDDATAEVYLDRDWTKYVIFTNAYQDPKTWKETHRTRVAPLADIIQR